MSVNRFSDFRNLISCYLKFDIPKSPDSSPIWRSKIISTPRTRTLRENLLLPSYASIVDVHFNPFHAKFFRGNKNIYLHFMSFLHMDMTQVVEILPHLFYIVHTMSADVLATQGARASSTMIITLLNRINSVPARLWFDKFTPYLHKMDFLVSDVRDSDKYI